MTQKAGTAAVLKALGRGVKLLLGVLLLVAAVFAMAWWIGLFSEKIPPGEAPVAVGTLDPNRQYATDEVHPIEKTYLEEAVGTLKAASRTEISSRVLAGIDKIMVRAGDMVEKQDVLIELDRKNLDAQVSQAEAALRAAEAAVVQTQDVYDRGVRLRNTNPGALSEQMFNEMVYRLEAARADKSRTEQALAEAEVNLSYATILAPKSGKIIETWAEEGDMARPGEPLLALYDPNSLRLEVPVMENLAVKLRLGAELDVSIDALDKKFPATVDEIVPQAEAASRSFLVKVSLPPSPDLFEGMYGRLEIPAGTRRHLCLNTAAIKRIGQLEFVYVDVNGRPEKRFIKTGRLGMPGRIEVLSGLEAGERVLLVNPPVEALDGQQPTP